MSTIYELPPQRAHEEVFRRFIQAQHDVIASCRRARSIDTLEAEAKCRANIAAAQAILDRRPAETD